VEVGRSYWDGAESAASHGWLFARPIGAIILKMPKAPEGLNSRERDFCLLFVFWKVGPPEGHA